MGVARKITFYLCFQFLLLISLFPSVSFAQKCFKRTIDPRDKAFKKTLHYPEYKGKESDLSLFIAKSIDFGSLSEVQKADREWQDSLWVRFVIGKDGTMSDLVVDSSDSDLAKQVKKAFKKTACNWRPGGTERLLNVWYVCIVYIKVEKSRNRFIYSVSVIPRNPIV